MSGLCEECRAMISGLKGLWSPIFVFCVMRTTSFVGVVGVGVIWVLGCNWFGFFTSVFR